jgi:threonyl-tRNA synthetase
VADRLREAGLRAELDESNEKLGYKIRQAQLEKVPYMLVVGEKEAAAGTAAVRLRSGEDLGPIGVEELARRLARQAARRSAFLPAAEVG